MNPLFWIRFSKLNVTVVLILSFRSLLCEIASPQENSTKSTWKMPNITCTPNVPSDICKNSSGTFLRLMTPGDQIDVVIADPVWYKQKRQSLMDEHIASYETKGTEAFNPTFPNPYYKQEEMLLLRDSGTCPKSLYISTDAFRPIKIHTKKEGDKVVYDRTEILQGFDYSTVSHIATYIDGTITGCRNALFMNMLDRMNKRKNLGYPMDQDRLSAILNDINSAVTGYQEILRQFDTNSILSAGMDFQKAPRFLKSAEEQLRKSSNWSVTAVFQVYHAVSVLEGSLSTLMSNITAPYSRHSSISPNEYVRVQTHIINTKGKLHKILLEFLDAQEAELAACSSM